MDVDEFLSRLDGVKRSGDKYAARCPAHDDRRQSLSVAMGSDGRVLVHCHAGCSLDSVCAAAGVEMTDLFVKDVPASTSGNGNGSRREIVATYDYCDENGGELFQKVRFDGKDFRQRRKVGGEWVWKLADTRRVLYRLPQVLDAVARGVTVYVVEGEKDVHAVEAAGGVATCNPEGASASPTSPKWRDEYSNMLAGGNVVVVQDKDDVGRNHARQVVESLTGKAAAVRLVEAASGKDAHDHLAAGGTLDTLVLVCPCEAADAGGGDPAVSEPSPFIDWGTFWTEEDEPDWAYPDILAWGRGHALYATHKAGKSLLALFIAAKVATESECHVLYVDYEMTERDVRERLLEMGYGQDSDLSRVHYALLPKMPPLDTEQGGEALMDLLDLAAADHPDAHFVVVIDTISRAVEGEENAADTWRFFYLYTGMRLKQRGCTWLRLDHAGKDSERGQRGSSGKGDDVDIVWKLTATQNGVQLKRELSRMGWVPEKVTLIKRESPNLHYIRGTEDDPAGTLEIVELLNALGLPGSATNAQARKAMREAGHHARNDVLAASVRWRQMAFGERRGERPSPFPGERNTGTAGNTQPNSLGNGLGNGGERQSGHSGECSPSLKGEQFPSPAADHQPDTAIAVDEFDF